MPTLLLIEDHAPLRRNLADMLALQGYRVLEAGDGPEGLRLARADAPDLVLCDIMLPGLDGLGVLAALRADPATVGLPLVFLTARGDPPDVRAGMNLGADDYLPKPVSRADLLAAVRTRLARAAQRRAFAPRFDSPGPLERLGLTAREAEVLLWVAQGKSNADVAAILDMSEKTAKQHLGVCFQKMGVEGRTAATVQAIEILSNPAKR